jgi:DNA ligase-1
MADLQDGESVEIKGSARLPYVLKNVGGVYSCSCPAWRNQSVGIERRTCKHLRSLRGEAAEQERIGSALPVPAKAASEGDVACPALLLAHTWTNDIDLSDWWMSEKLDGVRAYFDGKQFVSRLGNVFHAPDWFLAGFPSVPLDGELWLARKAFQRTVSIVRRQDMSDVWREIVYVVFDAPAVADPFERRLEYVQDLLTEHRPHHARAHSHEQCRNVDHLREELARIEALGGEGLMLRQPGSLYEAGRSTTLLKVKTFHDAEARVVEHLPGTGRHKGRLGALAVELLDGTSFSVGTGFSDAQRDNPPLVGSTITFRYQELSDRGVPRFPSFVGVRTDAAPAMSKAKAAKAQPAAAGVTASIENQTNNSQTTETSTMARHFEFVEGNSSKFWEVSQQGNDVTVRFGKIGTQGQTQTKSFDAAAAAQQHAEKLIAEKVKKGYVEST